MGRRATTVVYLVVALALPALVYHSITENYFHADDFLNLQQVVNDPLPRWILQPAAGHLLAFRNAVFSLFYAAFGPEPTYWFEVVLATHLLNVALLFGVVRRLTGSLLLACLGAAAWGMAPANEGSLGWYSVYGHVLVGTIVLVLLTRVARRLDDPAPLPASEALGWCLLLLLGSVSFGVGVGVALVFPAAALLLFPGDRTSRAARVLLLALTPVVAVGYAAAHILYGRAYGGVFRDSLGQLLGYAADVTADIAMFLHLLVVAAKTVIAGFGYPLGSYPSPLAYAIAAALGALGIGVAAVSSPATRRLLIALALLSAGCYAVIAAGRATLYEMHVSVPAHGAAQARYHYAGLIPVAVLVCVLLARVGERLRPLFTGALLAGWIALTLSFYLRSGQTIEHFTQDRQTTERVVETMRSAIRAVPPGQAVYLRNQYFPPAVLGAPFFAGWAALYTIYFPDDLDRHVYFVESNAAVRAVAVPGSRLASVLVPAAPADGVAGGTAP